MNVIIYGALNVCLSVCYTMTQVFTLGTNVPLLIEENLKCFVFVCSHIHHGYQGIEPFRIQTTTIL